MIIAVVLALLPAAVYWQTATHEYGFRDDYAHLRESHEEPGKLLRLTSSNGRPVYGLALEASVRGIDDVPDLKWLRLTSVVLLSMTSDALMRATTRGATVEVLVEMPVVATSAAYPASVT